MQVTINTLSDVQREADIQVTNDELQPHFQRAYEKYRPKVEIRGFRKGRAPMDMIKKLYGEAIEQDALDSIASTFFHSAMDEQKLSPIGQPALTDLDFKRGEHLRFKIKFEVKPVVELKDYKGIAVEKQVHNVSDAELQAEVDHLLRSNSTMTEVPSVTGPEHVVTGDVQELDDAGTPLIGKKTAGAHFLLSDATLAPEIRDALAHAEVGGTYRARFESKHEDHSHTVNVSITVTKIEKVDLPPFDDAFVKKLTSEKVSAKDEFLANMRADLNRYWAEQADKKLADDLANEIVRGHDDIAVPDSLVEAFLDSFVEDIKNRSRDKQLPRGFDEKKFRAESRAYAIWQTKWLLIRERIAEVEGLQVSDEEVETLAADDAGKLGIPKERLLQYYKSSDSARERLMSDKIMTFLKDKAKIKEKVVETPAE